MLITISFWQNYPRINYLIYSYHLSILSYYLKRTSTCPDVCIGRPNHVEQEAKSSLFAATRHALFRANTVFRLEPDQNLAYKYMSSHSQILVHNLAVREKARRWEHQRWSLSSKEDFDVRYTPICTHSKYVTLHAIKHMNLSLSSKAIDCSQKYILCLCFNYT